MAVTVIIMVAHRWMARVHRPTGPRPLARRVAMTATTMFDSSVK